MTRRPVFALWVEPGEPLPGVADAPALLKPLGGLLAAEIHQLADGTPLPTPCAAGLRLLAADEIQRLNHTFRHKDYVPNVLSFPADPADRWDADEQVHYLGDVALCPEVLAREAAEQGKTAADHLRHLALHGVLHLLGYDHENPAQAKTMESLEVRILAACGITNPYEDPADA
jgi:probable rRNA maturation factor